MSTSLRILGVLTMLAIVLLCAFVLPFPGWPLWYAISVGGLQFFSMCATVFFIASR